MAEVLGEGVIKVGVDDEAVGSKLRAIEANVEKTLKSIDGKEAEVLLKAEDKELKKAIKEAEARVDELDGKRADIEIDGDASGLEKEIKVAQAELKGLRDKDVKINAKTEKFVAEVKDAYARSEKAQQDYLKATDSSERSSAKKRLDRARNTLSKLESQEKGLTTKIVALEAQRVSAVANAEAKKSAIRQNAEAAAVKANADSHKKIEAQEKAHASRIAAIQKSRGTIQNNLERVRDNKQALEQLIAQERNFGRDLEGVDKAASNKRITELTRTGRQLKSQEAQLTNEIHNLQVARNSDASKLNISELNDRVRTINAETNAVKKGLWTQTAAVKNSSVAREKAHQKDVENIDELQLQYVKAARRVQELKRKTTKGGLFAPESDKIVMHAELNVADKDLKALRNRIENAVGKPPPTLDFNVDDHATRALSKFASAFSDTSVRLGPFTTSVKGAAASLAILGPIINGLVGAGAALAGALGTGLAGGIGILGTALGGAIPLMAGMGMAIVPVVKELKNAFAAQNKYSDAVTKYGEKSKQAKTAQEQMNRILQNQPASTQRAFKGLNDLRSGWQKLTNETARNSFGKVMEGSLRTANTLLPMFAKQTNSALRSTASGMDGWFKQLRSKSGRSALGDIFTGVNKAIRPAMAGIGQLGAVVGKVFASFARVSLPGIFKDFSSWATNLNKSLTAAQKSGALDGVVKNLDRGFRTVMGTIRSATNMLGTFFYKAATSGGGFDFLDKLNDGMDTLTQKMQAGGMDNFLKDAVKTTELLFDALKPVGKVFMEWTTITTPIVQALLPIAGAVANIVASLLELGAVKNIMTVALGGFVFAKFISGATLAATAITRLATAFGTASKASLAMGAANTLSGGLIGSAKKNAASLGATLNGVAAAQGRVTRTAGETTKLNGALKEGTKVTSAFGTRVVDSSGKLVKMEQGAVKAGATLSRFGKATNVAKAGVMGVTGALGINPWVAGAAAVGVLGYGIYKLATRTKDYEKTQQQLNKTSAQYRQSATQTAGLQDNVSTSVRQATDSQRTYAQQLKRVHELQKQGKQGTGEYRQERESLIGLEQARNADLNSRRKAVREYESNRKTTMAGAQKEVQLSRQAASQIGKGSIVTPGGSTKVSDFYNGVAKAATKAGMSVKDFLKNTDAQKKAFTGGALDSDTINQLTKYDGAVRRAATANKTLGTEQQRQALQSINQQRIMAGQIALTGKAATAVLNLQKAGGKKVASAAASNENFVTAAETRQVSNRASSALRGGASKKVVLDIVANSKSAEEAMRRLQGIKLTPKRLNIVESGGKAAVAMVQHLSGIKLSEKQQRIVQSGGAPALALLSKLNGQKLSPKVQKVITSGGPQAVATVEALIGKTVPPKIAKILTEGGPQAQQVLAALSDYKLTPAEIQAIANTAPAKADLGALSGFTVPPIKVPTEVKPPAGGFLSGIMGKVGGMIGGAAAIKIPSEITPPKNMSAITGSLKGKNLKIDVTGNAADKAKAINSAVNAVKGSKTVKINLSGNAAAKAQQVNKAVAAVKGSKSVKINLTGNAADRAKQVNSAVAAVKGSKTVRINLSGNAADKAKAVNAAVAAVKGSKTVRINASGNAAAVAEKAKSALSSVKSPPSARIKAVDGASGPANKAKSALASIKSPPSARISESGSGSVVSGANAAASAMRSIPASSSSTITVTRRNVTINETRSVKKAAGGLVVGGFASGGETPGFATGTKTTTTVSAIKTKPGRTQTGMASPPNAFKMDKAQARAEKMGVQPSRGGKYNRPRYLVGEENQSEYVIATNPRYRKRNQDYLVGAINAIGLPANAAEKIQGAVSGTITGAQNYAADVYSRFRKSTSIATGKANGGALRFDSAGRPITAAASGKSAKKKKPQHNITKSGRQKKRTAAKAAVTKGTTKVNTAAPQMTALASAQLQESNMGKKIDNYQASMAEPESLVKVVGQDPITGDDILGVDTGEVNRWYAQVEGLRKLYAQLVAAIVTVQTAALKAQTYIGDEKGGGALGSVAKNINVLKSLKTKAEDNSKAGGNRSKATRQGWAEQAKIYSAALSEATTTRTSLREDKSSIDAEVNDVPFRLEAARGEETRTAAERDAILGAAQADVGENNSKVSASSAAAKASSDQEAQSKRESDSAEAAATEADRVANLPTALDRLSAEESLASIGQGSRSVADIQKDEINENQKLIDAGRAMLNDSDVNNDKQAIDQINTAASNISSLQSALGAGTAAPLAPQLASLNSARADLTTGFASNAYSAMSAAGNAMSALTGSSSGAGTAGMLAGFNPGAAQQGGATTTTGSSVINKVVNNNNTFMQQPDPTTWSRDVAFQLNAAL
jgi:hypothetical protein